MADLNTILTVDDYIQSAPAFWQDRLTKVRHLIIETLPGAEEKISWQMPTYTHYGNVIHFAWNKRHLGLYPGTSGVEAFQTELKSYVCSKGAIQFPAEAEMPWDLIRRIAAFRYEENRNAWLSKRRVNFSPFPILSTPRLRLRSIEPHDAEDLFRMRSDPRMHRFTDTLADMTQEDTLRYMEKMWNGVQANQWIIWAMELRETKRVVGSISIWNLDYFAEAGELGYGIHPDFQHQGLMREALLAVIQYGFSGMRLRYLDAYTESENHDSIGLLKRCGFEWENRFREEGTRKEQVFSMEIFRRYSPRRVAKKP